MNGTIQNKLDQPLLTRLACSNFKLPVDRAHLGDRASLPVELSQVIEVGEGQARAHRGVFRVAWNTVVSASVYVECRQVNERAAWTAVEAILQVVD